ncbi:MAG TPA: DegT/DnrJ/EryC1/StrS family aminotransferase [Candidatus Saccharimonadales bacterium]|jgi:perosamine synthetase|nr:DegT/DnrJ/EryC1/StrS family aminotransferase [Candidatus Saccharimonadales bacterium]
MKISLSAPDIRERELEYVNRVLSSNHLSMGPWLDKFEHRFAEYIGTKHAIAVNSGTSGLHLCVRALDIGPKDAVITTSFSFVASTSCFLYEGALPIFVDIDPTTLNLDPAAVRDYCKNQCTRHANGLLIDRQTERVVKAILPVHVFGLPCPMDELMDVAREYGLVIIEDACEALGAEFDGKRAGTFGNAAVFAFYPNKQITTGEGGMITTDDDRVAELCRSMRNQGRDSDGAWLRHVRLGYNYRLSELHAALGLAQLERVDSILSSRAEVADHYTRMLKGTAQLQLLETDPRMKRSWFVYIIRFQSNSPEKLREHVRTVLREKEIATQIYFTAIHQQPFYLKCQSGGISSLPHTERAANECLAIPFHSRLSETEIKFVCDSIREALEPQKQESSANCEAAQLVSTQVMDT